MPGTAPVNAAPAYTATAKWLAACEDVKLYPLPQVVRIRTWSCKAGSLQGLNRRTFFLISELLVKSANATVRTNPTTNIQPFLVPQLCQANATRNRYKGAQNHFSRHQGKSVSNTGLLRLELIQ